MIPEKKQWQLVKSEAGPSLPLFQVRYDFQQNQRNGQVLKALVLESQDSVNVIAITPEKRVLLVQQLRFGTGTVDLELPGGLVDEGEQQAVAVRRELREETGYTSERWQYLGFVGSNPVFINSRIHHWLALDVRRTHLMSLDEGENIDVLEIPLTQIPTLFQEGKIQHPHTVAALARVMNLSIDIQVT